MRTLLVWLGAFIITAVIISPFFWLWFLKKTKKIYYVLYSSFVSLLIFLIFFFWGDNYLDKFFRKFNTELLYIYNESDIYAVIIYAFLMLISPFIFTKILYGRITVKSFFISLASSILILIIIFLIFAYYIVPKAFEGFLLNI